MMRMTMESLFFRDVVELGIASYKPLRGGERYEDKVEDIMQIKCY